MHDTPELKKIPLSLSKNTIIPVLKIPPSLSECISRIHTKHKTRFKEIRVTLVLNI